MNGNQEEALRLMKACLDETTTELMTFYFLTGAYPEMSLKDATEVISAYQSGGDGK